MEEIKNSQNTDAKLNSAFSVNPNPSTNPVEDLGPTPNVNFNPNLNPNNNEKKKRKKFLIPLFCFLGAAAVTGVTLGVYFAVRGGQSGPQPDPKPQPVPVPESEKPLTFECIEDGELRFREIELDEGLNLESSTDGNNWHAVEVTKGEGEQYYGATFNCTAGDKLFFRGNNHTFNDLSNVPDTIVLNSFLCNSGNWKVSGNVMSLLDATNFATLDTVPADTNGCFASLFSTLPLLSDSPKNAAVLCISDASKLYLPTGLAEECFSWMFFYCKIEAAPILSSTVMAKGCYTGMFGACDYLKEAPELPASTQNLAPDCYYCMFTMSAIESLKVGFDQNAFILTPEGETPYTPGWLDGIATDTKNEKHFYWKGTAEPATRSGDTIPADWTISTY